MENEIKRLSTGRIWAFSFATLGEYFVYFLFYNYFLYYLTDYVGIAAAIGGTILFTAMIWDAFTDPVIGYINDRSKNPKGRRRPMMIKTIIPFIITFGLCFIRPDIEIGPALYIYYGFVCLSFWLCFTCVQVPFYGLQPEIAHHEDDRLKIRQAMAFIGNGGNIMIGIVPIALEFVIRLGVDEVSAWAVTMFVLGAIGAIGFVVCYFASKGLETPLDQVVRPKGNLFSTYSKVIKIKGDIPVVLVYMFSTVAINIVFASIMYVGGEKLNLPAGQLSLVMMSYTFSGILFVPLITIMSKKFGSLNSFKFTLIAGIAGYIIIGFIGVNSFELMLIHGLLTGGCFVLFTAYTYVLFFEICDLAYLKTGEQLEGSIISFATFGYKVGAAISGFSMGLALTIIGYDGMAEVKSTEMLTKLDGLITFIPAVIIIVIFILLLLYPIKPKEYEIIKNAKVLKEEGKEYSIEGIEHLF